MENLSKKIVGQGLFEEKKKGEKGTKKLEKRKGDEGEVANRKKGMEKVNKLKNENKVWQFLNHNGINTTDFYWKDRIKRK